jgi:hypothetical protein
MRIAFAFFPLLLLTACSGSDIPSESPYKGQNAETYSIQLKRGRTIDSQHLLHWFAEYVSGYQEPDAGKMPTALIALKAATSCQIPRPAPGSKLVQVITWNSKITAPLYVIGEDELEKITKNAMQVVKGGHNPSLALSTPDGQLYAVDVAVTETAQPVHLVLSAQRAVVWNLVADPKAKITGITIISWNNVVALANADPDVPVTVLAGKQAEKCGATPQLMPVKEYPNIRMQLHKANDNDKKWDDKLAKYRDYNRFFKGAFGVDAAEVSIGASIMDHAAVGPVPAGIDARLPFKTLEGVEIRVTPGAFAFYGSEHDYLAAKKDAVIKTASRLSGSDFAEIMRNAGY